MSDKRIYAADEIPATKTNPTEKTLYAMLMSIAEDRELLESSHGPRPRYSGNEKIKAIQTICKMKQIGAYGKNGSADKDGMNDEEIDKALKDWKQEKKITKGRKEDEEPFKLVRGTETPIVKPGETPPPKNASSG